MAPIPPPHYQELSKQQVRIAELTKERDANKEALDQVVADSKAIMDSTDALHAAQLKAKEEELRDETTKRLTLERALDQASVQIAELQHQLENTRKDAASWMHEADEARNLALEMAAERDALQGKVSTVEDPLKARIDELKERLSEAGEARVTMADLQTKVADLERKVALLQPLGKLAVDASAMALVDPESHVRDAHLESCLALAVKAAKESGAV